MSTTDRPVLITGGTGFIGSYVARALLDCGRRVCLGDFRGLLAEANCVLGDYAAVVPVELASIDNWPRLFEVIRHWQPNQVVHIGGIVDPLFLFKNPSTALHVNVAGAVKVLWCARLLGVESCVYFSALGVLPAGPVPPIAAAPPIFLLKAGPASGAYGAAKVSGEAFCFAYYQAFGLDFRTIRPSAAYGFGMQWHSANYMKQFVEPAVRGEKDRLASGGPLPRDYTHVRDIASPTAAVLAAPAG